MAKKTEWGGEHEIRVASQLYQRNITVHRYDYKMVYQGSITPFGGIHLAHVDNSHYRLLEPKKQNVDCYNYWEKTINVSPQHTLDWKKKLKKLNMCEIDVGGGGDCLFRCLARAILGQQERHMQVRGEIVKYMKQHRNEFQDFFSSD